MPHSEIFGPPGEWPAQDLIAFSTEFDAALTLEAYRSGVFPMPLHSSGFSELGWWSPTRRGVLPLASLRVTRSMRQAAKHYTTTVDQAFDQVLAHCADPARPNGWIDAEIVRVYTELQRAGRVHSVETWDAGGRLVGGLYGVNLGGLFAGESMFHDPVFGRDASKVALMTLVGVLDDERGEDRIIDVQWQTEHLARLGAIEIDREEYLGLLDEALAVPEPDWTRSQT
ncbi:MAG: leucyl/phenylalanyl-tRNA--protein transferase [Propionicimonas sp.]|nr:leucyl/phenylalanyl-tRNA--protein transferase [Propionicimonas sp.]